MEFRSSIPWSSIMIWHSQQQSNHYRKYPLNLSLTFYSVFAANLIIKAGIHRGIQHFFTPSLHSISSKYMGNSFLEPDITNFSVTAINSVHVRQTGERSAFVSGRQCLWFPSELNAWSHIRFKCWNKSNFDTEHGVQSAFNEAVQIQDRTIGERKSTISVSSNFSRGLIFPITQDSRDGRSNTDLTIELLDRKDGEQIYDNRYLVISWGSNRVALWTSSNKLLRPSLRNWKRSPFVFNVDMEFISIRCWLLC